MNITSLPGVCSYPITHDVLGIPLAFQASLEMTALKKQSECVWCYTDLLKYKRIEVWLHPTKGFSARVHHLASSGESVRTEKKLPLVGLHPLLSKERDFHHLLSYFIDTHLILEKGVNGMNNRIVVHHSAKGGVKAALPFQPGLAMGSIVRGTIIDKMEKYANAMAKKEAFEEQLRGSEQRIEALETKISSRIEQKKLDPLPSQKITSFGNIKLDQQFHPDILVNLWYKEIIALSQFISKIGEELEKNTNEALPVFEGFQQGIVSPIDMGASPIEIQPRSFDSLTFNSQYINKEEKNSEVHNRITESASTSSYSASGGWGIWTAGVNHARAEAVARRVANIQKESSVEGVLVINAVATTRHVRCFKEIKYDMKKLRQIFTVMEEANAHELERYGITVPDAQDPSSKDKEKVIYLLTEAVLGGSFTALVTFLDSSKMRRDMVDQQTQKSQSTSVSAGGGFWSIRARAQYANASASASKEEDDVLRSIAQTRVRIEFISQGALPTFERNVIEREVFKHLDLNPSKFELSQQDSADAEQMIKAEGKAKEIAMVKSTMKLQNAQVAFLNTYRGLTSEKEKANLHTMESVMGAYENFAEQMTQDKECGVPMGFYYQVLTQSEIKRILEENKSKQEVPQ